MEHYGGGIGRDSGPIAQVKKDTKCTDDKAPTKARDCTIALDFLCRSDQRCFGTLFTDLENQFSCGNDQYPTDLTAVYSMLVNFRVPRTHPPWHHPAPSPSTGVSFAQTLSTSPPVAGSDGQTHGHITCYQCNRKGHYSSACPSPPTAVQLVQTSDFSFAQQHLSLRVISPSWVLLDSQSTVSVFNNPSLLCNIRRGVTTLTVHSTGGVQHSHLIGDIPNFGWVWFNPDSIMNILLLAQVRQRCSVTMDTACEPALYVHKVGGGTMKFTEYPNGLYFHDTSAVPSVTPSLTTVASQHALFPARRLKEQNSAAYSIAS